jgi:hypothetical protein
MATAIAEINNSYLQNQITSLQEKILVLQEELNTLIRGAKGVVITLPELHDPASGRIHAQKIADFLGIPLKRLAEGLGLNYKAVHRNPSAASLQATLQPVKRMLELLHEFFPDPESARIWLNTLHPDLAGQTALQTMLTGKPEAVLVILENATAGVPA